MEEFHKDVTAVCAIKIAEIANEKSKISVTNREILRGFVTNN